MPETRKRIDVLVTVEAREVDSYRSVVERELKISAELVAMPTVQQAIALAVGEAIADVLAEASARSAPAAEDLGDHHVFPGASR